MMSAPLHPVSPPTRAGPARAWPRVAGCALALVALGCDGARPADLLAPDDAPAEAVLQSWSDRGGDIFWNFCAGEFVGFADGARRHGVYKSRTDGTGGYLIMYHGNGAGYGGPGLDCEVDGGGSPIPPTCQPTGSYYHGNNPVNYTIHAPGPFPFSFSYTSTARVARSGPGGGFLHHAVDHVTVNANGEVTADVYDAWIECI